MESLWRGGLQALLLTYVNHNDAAPAALTIEHLAGTGARADPVAQAQHCPRAALEAIREEAKKAFSRFLTYKSHKKLLLTSLRSLENLICSLLID